MAYCASDIQSTLEDRGEIIVTLESGRDIELHRHDTDFPGDNEVAVAMTDGGFSFTADRVESVAYHYQSLEEVGL